MPFAALADPQTVAFEAVKKVNAIAALPEVTARIIATVEDPRASAKELHQIVSHDPALVTRILKIVNSSFYGLPGQIGSVERAIVLLGLNAVKNIAVAASLGQMFRGSKLGDHFSAKDLWTHCIAVGVAARDLAKQMALPMADEAFLAGMIHDVGILIALQQWPEQVNEVCNQVQASGGDYCQLERDLTGTDHQWVGMALAEQWKFPRTCQLVAGYHHRPAALGDQARMLVALVYAADTICCASSHAFNLTALHQRLDDAHLSDLKIERVFIERTITNLDKLLAAAAAMLG